MPKIVAVGHPFGGMTLYGPFDDVEDALDFLGDSKLSVIDDAWIVNVVDPEDDSE